MSYRGDEEAARVKIEKLERELAEAEAKIAVLQGKKAVPEAKAETGHSRLLGAPTSVLLVHEVAGEIDDAGYEAIAAVARQRFAVQVSQVGRTMHAGNFLSVTHEAGRTIVRVQASWSALDATPFLTAASAAFLGGGLLTGVLHDVGHLPTPILLANLVWAVPAIGLGAGWWTRRWARRQAEKNLERYRGLFATAVELAEKHAVRGKVRARVAEENGGEAVEHESEEERGRRDQSA